MKKLIFLVMLFTLAFAGSAFAATYGDYEYTDNGDGTVTITNYLGTNVGIVIPDQIGSVNQIIISSQAFENKGLYIVEIPQSVISIGSNAFSGNGLSEVKIYNPSVSIDPTAFANTQAVPSDLTIYGYSGSTAESLAMSKGYTFVPLSAPVTSGFKYTDNMDGTATITGYDGTIPQDLVIPDTINGLTVVEIAPSAFASKGLTSATIPSSVTTIGTDAFVNNAPSFKIRGESGTAAETYATVNGIPFEDISGASGTGGTEPISEDVTVTGSVYAIVLRVTVPSEVTFVIDPNQENVEDRFISPVLTVQNQTNAPVKVSIASFDMKQESIDKGFQSVAPSLFTDVEWSKLNKTDSKKLAVGIKADKNWQVLDNASTQFANNFSNQVIGTIAANGTSDFVFEAKHGNAFDKAEIIKYTVSFVIELD
ncbi:leucine-rich repeat protein [Paenibacillus thailandensis]|uniref:Leucine-rich repeat protein n=2 Tax=Paenibacillus thailandensis TaxID=393250 RepID=A0ABW5QRT7_9BACL